MRTRKERFCVQRDIIGKRKGFTFCFRIYDRKKIEAAIIFLLSSQ